MKKYYKAIKNEAYPVIAIIIILFFITIMFFAQSSISPAYPIIAIILLIIGIALIANFYGMMFASIAVDQNKIEYLYYKKRSTIKWNDILSVVEAYPNKTIFAKRKDLYKINVIKIISTDSEILFHYTTGQKIESLKKINRPYTTDPQLPKGMWLSVNDAKSFLNTLINKLGKNIVKVKIQ